MTIPPCTVRQTLSSVALSLGAALLCTILSVSSRAAGLGDGPGADAVLRRDAEALQNCLERQLWPWQIESTVSEGGRLTDTVRMTRWGGAPEGHCRISTVATGKSCAPPQGLQRIVGLDLRAGEPHPAWSANDRARVEDLIASSLRALEGDVRLGPAPSGSAVEHIPTLRVRIGYRGAPTLQRDLAEWFRGPRALSVTMTLIETHGRGRVLALKEITVRQGPQWSDPAASTSGTRWMTRLVETVDETAKTLIAPLACATPWLEVTTDRGRLWLSDVPYVGLKDGATMLLVPTAEAGSANRWPIARVHSLGQGSRAELEIVSGARETCKAGCHAVPL